MKRKRLNIQWRFINIFVAMNIITLLFVLTIVMSYFKLNPLDFLSLNWFNIPFIFFLLFAVIGIGVVAGYSYGNPLKERLEVLFESILRYEKGNFSYRLSNLGEDEVGLIGEQLNQMASQIEKQVASLQKLSTEKVEWRDQLRRSAVVEERQRLARELHDAVSQQLFAISMMSSAVKEMTQQDSKHLKQLTLIEKMAGDAQNEMRALLLHLRPATLENKSLNEGLQELLQELNSKQTMDIHWDFEDILLSKGIEDHLFRIVQEALSNVFRHSKASAVVVKLHKVHNGVYLKIIDNGVGFVQGDTKASSYGLQSITERASEVGGVAEIISLPDKGTQITVKIPIVDESKERE
ncbi:sensor histidine kinase [Priestia endophytica]|uniref:sensor histidine kinase n=1 Tax=Priestia endophytica TaxID=135735 RepID=UPI000DCA4422|nr:sensor histidine kinase [Priestia endophytica]RAS81261.1 sensor histidine kinase [Priestia endophytica]